MIAPVCPLDPESLPAVQNSSSPPLLSSGSEQEVELSEAVKNRPDSIAWMTDELIAETRRVWSPHYGRVISEDEAIDILHNVKRFVQLLWSIKRDEVQQ
jgi:hypothetical protein